MNDTGVYLCTDKNELAQGRSVRVMETSWGESAGEYGMLSQREALADGRDSRLDGNAGWVTPITLQTAPWAGGPTSFCLLLFSQFVHLTEAAGTERACI